MATEYAFVDDSGTTRLEGFLVPEPGGSLPSQWTTDDKGNLRIQSDGSGNGLGWNGLSGIIIRSSTSANDALVITDENGNAVILIDPFGTFAGSYLALSGNNSGAGAKIAAIEGGDIASAAFDYLEVDAAGTYLFRIQADGSTTIFDATGVAAFKVAADGSVHIRTGTSIIADL